MQNKECRQIKKNSQSGAALIVIIISILLIGVLTAALYSLNTTSLMNFITYNNNENAYYLAEAGVRYAAGIYLHTKNTDTDDNNADDDKRKVLQDHINGCTYHMPHDKGKFDLKVQTYWLYNDSGTTFVPGSTAKLQFAVDKPDNFEIPSKGMLWRVHKNGLDEEKLDYSSGMVTADGVQCTLLNAGASIFSGDSIYFAVHPSEYQGNQTIKNNGTSKILLRCKSDINKANACLPLKNGFFEIKEGSGKCNNRFFYKTATMATGHTMWLKGITSDSHFSQFEVDKTSLLVFKKNLILQSTGKIGSKIMGSSRKINYAIPVSDTSLSSSSGSDSGGFISTVQF